MKGERFRLTKSRTGDPSQDRRVVPHQAGTGDGGIDALRERLFEIVPLVLSDKVGTPTIVQGRCDRAPSCVYFVQTPELYQQEEQKNK